MRASIPAIILLLLIALSSWAGAETLVTYQSLSWEVQSSNLQSVDLSPLFVWAAIFLWSLVGIIILARKDIPWIAAIAGSIFVITVLVGSTTIPWRWLVLDPHLLASVAYLFVPPLIGLPVGLLWLGHYLKKAPIQRATAEP